MTDFEQPKDQLWVSLHDKWAIVYVQGRGSFKISSALRDFGIAALSSGCDGILFDMAECVGMDSTFMGVIAGLAFRLKKKNSGTITVVNLSSRTRGLMATLGLDQTVSAFLSGSTPEEFEPFLPGQSGLDPLPVPTEDRETTATTMLEAHEDLVKVSPGNYPKFRDVLTFLREDLKQTEPKNEGETAP